MRAPKLARERRLLERGLPWFLLAFFASGCAVVTSAVLDLGLLREYELFPAIVRGYTPAGTLFGLLATCAVGVTLFYSLRRRSLQETLPIGRGTLSMWLWAHVTLGGLALVFACVHAGYGALSLQPSLGKALLALLLLTSLSGVFWRTLYARVPRRAAREVGNYAADESLSRARAQAVEIDKLAAGRSPRLQELVARVLAVKVDAAEAGRAAAALEPAESAAFAEIARLASERHAALARAHGQERFVQQLQGARVWHVPVSLLFVLLLPLHVLFAYDIPERFLARAPATSALAFEPATTCTRCHRQIVEEWRTSMHAHALDGPIMRVQTNLAARTTLAASPSPDPKLICVNCHGPIAARAAQSATLPFQVPTFAEPEQMHEGVTCVACHAQQTEGHTGGAGLSAFAESLAPGRTYFGPYDDPNGNAFHRSERSPHFANTERLCQNCHSVVYDRDGDGRIEKGKDLVLQDLFSEWQAYRAAQGSATCIDCHMPAARRESAANSASIFFEQDHEPPQRLRRVHHFVGPDYPLDQSEVRDQTRTERTALLASAARLELTSVTRADGAVRFEVSVTNSGTGHNLPGGFAFVRQMWIELTVFDKENHLLASSGHLRGAGDDLCDTELLQSGRALSRFAAGCTQSDPQLANFQQRLVDRIEVRKDRSGNVVRDARGEATLVAAPGADEVVVQHITGGPVPRTRPSDGALISPLAPGESRRFNYEFSIRGASMGRVEARLLFRAVPPYFLRALGSQQLPSDGERLDAFIQNLEVVEMASAKRGVVP